MVVVACQEQVLPDCTRRGGDLVLEGEVVEVCQVGWEGFVEAFEGCDQAVFVAGAVC